MELKGKYSPCPNRNASIAKSNSQTLRSNLRSVLMAREITRR
jgi:hypothetical protein